MRWAGVPLLLGGGLVGVQDGPDDGQDGFDLGPPGRPGPPVARRLLVGQDLLEGQPVDLVLAAGLPLADLIGQDAAADLGPELLSAYTSVPPAGRGDGEIPILLDPRQARLCAAPSRRPAAS